MGVWKWQALLCAPLCVPCHALYAYGVSRRRQRRVRGDGEVEAASATWGDDALEEALWLSMIKETALQLSEALTL